MLSNPFYSYNKTMPSWLPNSSYGNTPVSDAEKTMVVKWESSEMIADQLLHIANEKHRENEIEKLKLQFKLTTYTGSDPLIKEQTKKIMEKIHDI